MEIKPCNKDSLFKGLFSDPENLLDLYRCLHPEDKKTRAEDIQTVTLDSVFVAQHLYNDLGFRIGQHLIVLVEAQSSWSPNIVFRAAYYLMQTYWNKCLPDRHQIYENALLRLPRPELYMIYTGRKGRHPDHLSLKSLFFDAKKCDVESQPCDLDATIHILYDKTSKGVTQEYIIFCQVLEQQFRIHGRNMKAVEEAIHICQDKNILKAYLETRKAELMDFMDYVFNQEAITRDWVEHECRKAVAKAEAKAEKRGEARGRAEGKTEAQLALIANLMRSMSLTSDVAMEALNIPLEERAHYAEQLARQNA